MNTLILLLHISAALVTTGATIGVVTAAIRSRETKLYQFMLGSFGATAVSGIGLLFAAGGLGRFCAAMSSYALIVGLVRHFYTRRLAAQTVISEK